MNDKQYLKDVQPLTHEQRLQAKEHAAKLLAGAKPAREQFDQHAVSKYPPNVQRAIIVLAVLVLVAAFTPSAMRLFEAGSSTFGEGIAHATSATFAGIATVVLAETGQLIFSIALAVLAPSRVSHAILYAGMSISTAIALVGNWTVAAPRQSVHAPFAVLEAVAPPLLVLGTAYVLKERILESVGLRYANNAAHAKAVQAWQNKLTNAEQDKAWGRFYVQSLKDAIAKANNRGQRKQARDSLSELQWRDLIMRELHADVAFASLHEVVHDQQRIVHGMEHQAKVAKAKSVQVDAASFESSDAHADADGGASAERAKPPNNAGVRTGEFADAVEPLNGMWVATCPYCGREFEKPTENKARLALTAHKRGCKVAKKIAEAKQPALHANGNGNHA